jgi:predicted nucleotidyltransferase
VLIGMEIELSELARRRVDLRMYDQLKHGTARRLLDGAKTIFVT